METKYQFKTQKALVYDITVNDDDEFVNYVALTDNPAIEQSFMYFEKAKQQHKFVGNAESRTIFGPLILADTPIERVKDGQTFFVRFPKETVRKIAQKVFDQNKQKNVNAYHKTPVEGLVMYESMITDFERGVVNPKGYEDVPEGSWFGGYYVQNQSIWENFIKTGVFTGFSVEGMFGLELALSKQQGGARSQLEQSREEVFRLLQKVDEILHHL